MKHPTKWQAFWRGVARTLDMGGTLPPLYPYPKMTDAEALASDWQAVGDDIRNAMESTAPLGSESAGKE